MKCSDLRKLMPELAAEELSPEILAAVQDHLSTCEACSARLASYRLAEQALRAHSGAVECPGELTALDLDDVPGRRSTVFRPAYGLAIAAALVVVITTACLLRHGPQRAVPVPPKAQGEMVKFVPHKEDEPKPPAGGQNEPRDYSTPPVEHRPYKLPPVPGQPHVDTDKSPKPEIPHLVPPAVFVERPEDKILENPSARILVVASRVEPVQPYEIEVKTRDRATGQESIYCASLDESGNAQEMSVSTAKVLN